MSVVQALIILITVGVVFLVLDHIFKSNNEINGCNQDCNQGRNCKCGPNAEE